jgi:hypothetical protein
MALKSKEWFLGRAKPPTRIKPSARFWMSGLKRLMSMVDLDGGSGRSQDDLVTWCRYWNKHHRRDQSQMEMVTVCDWFHENRRWKSNFQSLTARVQRAV